MPVRKAGLIVKKDLLNFRGKIQPTIAQTGRGSVSKTPALKCRVIGRRCHVQRNPRSAKAGIAPTCSSSPEKHGSL